MFDLVCVGYDGSPTSDHAVDWAAAEAERRGAVLRIVSCYEVPRVGPESGMTLDQVRMLETRTDADVAVTAARAVADHPGLQVHSQAVAGTPRRVFVADAMLADLVVLGAVGRVRTLRRQLGATARSLCRHSQAPVAVVPAHAGVRAPKRILVGFDGSRHAPAALEWALAHSAGFETPLVVVYADGGQARDSAAVLARTASIAIARPIVSLTTRRAHGEAASALTHEAQPDDVVVIGRRRITAVASTFSSVRRRAS